MVNFDINNLKTVPHKPGVYFWKDKNNNIIYVGKAKDLSKRMHQYFGNRYGSYMTNDLVRNIYSFDYLITKDEKDALILENNLIKKHQPKYNLLLLDDKGYTFIRIKKMVNDIQFKMQRIVKNDGALYYGPFPPRHNAKNILNLLIRLTKFKDGIPYSPKNEKYWEEKFLMCKEILNPNDTQIRQQLKNDMLNAAKNENFELANDYKKILLSLKFYLMNNSTTHFKSNKNQDIWGISKNGQYFSIYIMFYRMGKLLSVMSQIIDSEKVISLTTFINKFYSQNIKPDEIIINKNFINADICNVKHIYPQKGKYLSALNIAIQNSHDNLKNKISKFITDKERENNAINKLGELLNISTPNHIIMIDNSVTSIDQPVTGLVSYRNAKKQKKEYRKYNLIVSERHSDVEYMRQAIIKFLDDYKNKMPDLLILDGGKPQVSEVRKVIKSYKSKININFIGLVKDNKHQTRAIINSKGKEIMINDNNLLNFLANMQIEVDRFARFHHSKRRKISTLEGKLTQIKGIGLKTESKLLNHFNTYSNIYNSSIEQLSKVVSIRLAKKIKKIL